jgi:hypothetical protein
LAILFLLSFVYVATAADPQHVYGPFDVVSFEYHSPITDPQAETAPTM